MTTAALQARWRIPLYRNGYLLILSSAASSGLGLLYWLLAARSYSAYDLGLSAGLISAMTMLANLAQLNLKGALNRFLPTAGARARTLTLRAYAVAVVLAALAACVFLVLSGTVAPDLAALLANPGLAAWFVLATMAWTVFVLQDSVLAGLRQAGLVPVENVVFSIAKITLVVALAAVAPMTGAFLSWTVPVVALIVPVNLIVFRRLIPAHVADTAGRERFESHGRIARYLAADSVAYGIWTATIGVLALCVLDIDGPTANAQFFVCWSIAYALYLISMGMGQSLLAEASLDPDAMRHHARRCVRDSLALVTAAAVTIAVLAPQLLAPFGGAYSADASATLRCLVLSAIPFAYTSMRVTVARAQGRMTVVIAIYATLSMAVFAVGIPWLHRDGIVGLAAAWLIAQAGIAVGLLAQPHAAATWRRRSAGGRTRLLRALGRNDWRITRRFHSGGDVTILGVGPLGDPTEAIVRIAKNEHADVALGHHAAALAELDHHAFIPSLRAYGRVGPRRFTLEAALPGRPAVAALRRELSDNAFLATVEATLRPVHGENATARYVDDEFLDTWVRKPLNILERVLSARRRQLLAPLRTELEKTLRGRRLECCAVHGDLWPGNILVDDSGAVTGVLDWETHAEVGLRGVDLMHLLLTTRSLTAGRELGTVVVDMLGRPQAHAPHRTGVPSTRILILLAWLGHVTSNIEKSPRYARNPLWVRRNVARVVDTVAAQYAAAGAVAVRRSARAASWPRWAAPAAMGTGLALWWLSLLGVRPQAMTDLGLVSVLRPEAFAGLGLLAAGAAVELARSSFAPRRVMIAVTALIVTLHATPSVIYPTLRYAWAYKHVGIVDFISRHGGVRPGIGQLPVYHNWPGFFGLDSLATALAGLPSAMGQAVWAPPVFNLLDLAAFYYLVTGITADKRVAWRAAWLFFIASWVGQDYFSPQAFAFLLYLSLCGAVVRWKSAPPSRSQIAIAACLTAAIVVSHPLTAVMAIIALVAISVVHTARAWPLSVAAIALCAGWDLGFARRYTDPNIGGVLRSIHLPWQTASETLARTGPLSHGQTIVALAGRGLVLCILILAAVGVVRMHRAGRLHRAAAVLAVAPVVLFAAGDYDGEMLFRVYLFALPFLALLAAHAFREEAAPLAAMTMLMLGLFLFAYYGKDHQYVFTRGELAASAFVYDRAAPGTLLIEGTPDYPAQFAHYENVTHVPLSGEDDATQSRVAQDPAAVLAGWMRDPRYASAYVILTRSQLVDAREIGTIDPARLQAVHRSLSASPRFRVVFSDRDATVFALAPAVHR